MNATFCEIVKKKVVRSIFIALWLIDIYGCIVIHFVSKGKQRSNIKIYNLPCSLFNRSLQWEINNTFQVDTINVHVHKNSKEKTLNK